MRYKKDDNVFYQNNPATFISYLTDKKAVIMVELEPDFENIETSSLCSACMIGDSDNKLSCNCEDTEHLLELIEENTSVTEICLVVSVNAIYDKPIVILKHEKEVNELLKFRTELYKSNIVLKEEKSKLTIECGKLVNEINKLQIRKQEYSQIKEFTLEQFAAKLAESMFHIMYSENDSRKIVGGNEKKGFNFEGKKYEIDVNGFWEKSDHYNYIVTGEDYTHEGCSF